MLDPIRSIPIKSKLQMSFSPLKTLELIRGL